MSIGVELIGSKNLLKLINMLMRLKEMAEDPAGELLEWMLERLREYPPPKPSYQRTYALKFSWQIVSGGGNLGAVRSTGVAHAPYVQDEDEQAWMHAGRGWNTVQSVSGEADERGDREFDAWLQELIDGYG